MIVTKIFQHIQRIDSTNLLIAICALISLILCFFPIINGWIFFTGGYELGTAPIYSSIKSNEFENSLIVCYALGIPICLELLLNAISPSFASVFSRTIGKKQFTLVLVGTMVPDVLTLAVVIPTGDPALHVCLFHSRQILVWSAIASHLYEYGGGFFQGYMLKSAIICGNISFILVVWYPFFGEIGIIIEYMYFALSVVVMVLLSIMTLNWYLNMRKKPFMEITANEYSCCVYFATSIICGTAVVCLCLVSGGVYDHKTPTYYLVFSTYGVAFFLVTVAVFHVRLAVVEVIRTQEEILNMKRSFVRFVSHEIRTPLNTVVVGLDVLKKMRSMDPEALDTIIDLSFSCDIAIDTLNDLLNYEKVESGLMTLDSKVFSVMPTLTKALHPFYIQARHANISLRLINNIEQDNTSPHHIFIKADECKICQVIRNLVSNALKFTPPNGDISVSVDFFYINDNNEESSESKYREIGSSKWLRIKVEDSGAGISHENLPRVFREIIQFSPGKLQRGGGSGLGLWISKAIIDMHKGHISVHSDGEGYGCTFTVDLPLHIVPEHSEVVSAPEAMRNSHADRLQLIYNARIAPTTTMHAIKPHMLTRSSSVEDQVEHEVYRGLSSPMVDAVTAFNTPDSRNTMHENTHCRENIRLLAVDDAIVNLKMMCRGLRSSGYKDVIQAENGEKALLLVQEAIACDNPFHVVLMDYQMPIMDGPTAAKHMREIGFTGKIYGVTGNALNKDIDYYLSQGANEVFTKPLSIKKLDNFILADYNAME